MKHILLIFCAALSIYVTPLVAEDLIEKAILEMNEEELLRIFSYNVCLAPAAKEHYIATAQRICEDLKYLKNPSEKVALKDTVWMQAKLKQIVKTKTPWMILSAFGTCQFFASAAYAISRFEGREEVIDVVFWGCSLFTTAIFLAWIIKKSSILEDELKEHINLKAFAVLKILETVPTS